MASANGAAALTGAVVVRRILGRTRDMRVVVLLRFVYATAAGAVAGMLVRALTLLATDAGPAVSMNLLVWGQASLLGAVITVPPLLAWLVSRLYTQAYPALSNRQRVELVVVLTVQVLIALRVFGGMHIIGPENTRFPVMMLPGLIYAAFRLPPRWATSLAGGTGLLAMWLVAKGGNPLLIEDPLVRVLWVQFGVLVFLLAAILLVAYIAQSHLAVRELEASQARYRSFIELTSEAVWRVELAQPMPVDLPLPQQIEWLRLHASIAESSASYGMITGDTSEGRRGWAADVPWVRMFEDNLGQVGLDGYRADALRFSTTTDGRTRTFLTSFSGVVDGGKLHRIWGVARDSTELLDLNTRLQREQDLLRSYAQRIAGAEEKARHSTAVDLHNGIGQELSAMGMMLSALAVQIAPEQRPQVDELRRHLHKVQQRTRDMVSDLSPPGLYDLGLVPALQWLAVYLRSHEQLRVQLDGDVDEKAVPTSLRVVVFKQVRELLRNVARHSGTDAATVTLRGDRERLVVSVADEGKGFEWDAAHLTNPPRGLGLWSIGNRMAEVGGRLQVETAPGQGARVTLEFPLRGLSA
jgi:signal transduction histidine kinase